MVKSITPVFDSAESRPPFGAGRREESQGLHQRWEKLRRPAHEGEHCLMTMVLSDDIGIVRGRCSPLVVEARVVASEWPLTSCQAYLVGLETGSQ